MAANSGNPLCCDYKKCPDGDVKSITYSIVGYSAAMFPASGATDTIGYEDWQGQVYFANGGESDSACGLWWGFTGWTSSTFPGSKNTDTFKCGTQDGNALIARGSGFGGSTLPSGETWDCDWIFNITVGTSNHIYKKKRGDNPDTPVGTYYPFSNLSGGGPSSLPSGWPTSIVVAENTSITPTTGTIAVDTASFSFDADFGLFGEINVYWQTGCNFRAVVTSEAGQGGVSPDEFRKTTAADWIRIQTESYAPTYGAHGAAPGESTTTMAATAWSGKIQQAFPFYLMENTTGVNRTASFRLNLICGNAVVDHVDVTVFQDHRHSCSTPDHSSLPSIMTLTVSGVTTCGTIANGAVTLNLDPVTPTYASADGLWTGVRAGSSGWAFTCATLPDMDGDYETIWDGTTTRDHYTCYPDVGTLTLGREMVIAKTRLRWCCRYDQSPRETI